MFLNIFLLSFFSILPAKEITVSAGNSSFNILMDQKKISLTGYLVSLNMTRKKCNAHIMDEFKKNMEKLVKTTPLSMKEKKNKLKISIDGSIYYVSYYSKKVRDFLYIPRELQRMKIEEKFLCYSNKRPTLKRKMKI